MSGGSIAAWLGRLVCKIQEPQQKLSPCAS